MHFSLSSQVIPSEARNRGKKALEWKAENAVILRAAQDDSRSREQYMGAKGKTYGGFTRDVSSLILTNPRQP